MDRLGRQWSADELELLRQHWSGLTHKQLAKKLGRTVAAISLKLSRTGLVAKQKEFWNTDEDQILFDNIRTGRLRDLDVLATLLPQRSKKAIVARAVYLGDRTEPITYNKKFFKSPNLQNSYWAGLIAADGDIQTAKSFVTLKLKRTDESLIESFRLAIDYSGEILRYTSKVDPRTGKCYHSSLIRLGSCRELINDLKRNWNITGKKSLTLKAPIITKRSLKLAFLIGLIDGDGHIKRITQYKYLRVQLSGTREILKWAKTIFDDLAPPKFRSSNVRPNGRMFDLIVTGQRAEIIAAELMKVPVGRLWRKWNAVLRPS